MSDHERDAQTKPHNAGEMDPESGPDESVPIRQPGVGTAQQPAVRRPDAPTGETGGPDGPEPTRYGDWERNGRCTDF